LPKILHLRLAQFADNSGEVPAPVTGAQGRRQMQQHAAPPQLNHVRCHNFLTAEVESDANPSTPPRGSNRRRIENGRKFAEERQALLSTPIGDANWDWDSRLVVVVFDEFDFTIDAKIDGRAANIGSQQQVQLVEQNVPLGLDGVRLHEGPGSSLINCHYVRRPKLTARSKGFAKPEIQVESAVFVDAWICQDYIREAAG
jgi:hypothetical protein